MNTAVLEILTGMKVNNPRDIIDRGFIGNSSDTAGCLLKTFEVHSICKGIVISIDYENKGTWCITVEVNSQRWIRYCGLASVKIKSGQTLFTGDFLGYGYRGMMQLEYCTSDVNSYPVRLASKQLYKHDPSPVIFGQENPEEVS